MAAATGCNTFLIMVQSIADCQIAREIEILKKVAKGLIKKIFLEFSVLSLLYSLV